MDALMNVPSAKELAALPLRETLQKIRKVPDASRRRAVTRDTHALLLGQWRQHQNWGGFGMARHLVEDVHLPFRRGFERVRETRDPRSFASLNSSLHHHHTLEDRAFFPQMRQQHPDWANEFDILEDDHRDLVRLEKSIDKGEVDSIPEFVDMLLDHLNREEMITIPLLLESGGM